MVLSMLPINSIFATEQESEGRAIVTDSEPIKDVSKEEKIFEKAKESESENHTDAEKPRAENHADSEKSADKGHAASPKDETPGNTVTITPTTNKVTGSEEELTEDGIDLTVDKKTEFLIKIKATFPTSATDKSIKIDLPYGMTWCYQSQWYPSYNQIDTSAAWYQELKTPVNTVGMVKSDFEKMTTTGTVKRNLYDGSVTFNFKDGLNTVEFSIGVSTMDAQIGITGLESIKDAITVSQSYNTGTVTTIEKKLSNLKLTGILPIVTKVGYNGAVLNSDGEMEVPQGGTSNNNVYWTARPGTVSDGDDIAHDDYSLSFLVPSNVGYDQIKQQNAGALPVEISGDSPVKTQAGEKITLSTGEEYTVPAGMNVWTFKVNESLGRLPSDSVWHGCFPIVWSFEDPSIQEGDKITVKMLDVNMKYHHSDETISYDSSKLPSFTYKIVGKEEQVFTNVSYADSNSLQGGSISSKKLNRGSQYYLGRQEYAAGYFIVGNRGTGDSVAKTIHIVYDVNDTGIMGVKEQMIPRNEGVTGAKDTKITGAKVKLWDGQTTETVTDWIPIDTLESTLRVTQVPGYEKDYKGYFLKEIQYDVDTIPAQSMWGSAVTAGGSEFSYYGTVLTSSQQPQSGGSKYKCILEITDQDGLNSNGKQVGNSYTGFTGKISVGGTYPMKDDFPPIVAGTTAKISANLTLGSGDGANIIDEAYIISPYGAPLTDITVKYDEGSKTKYASADANKLQPEISQIPATDEVKATYPDAKVYKLDFTKITGNQDIYDARVLGTSVQTQKAYDEIPLSSYGGVSQWVTRIDIEATLHSDISDPVGKVGGERGNADALVWVKMNRPDDDTDVEYVGGPWVKDTFNLTGDKETLLNNGGSLTIKATPDVIATSSAKMETEPDSAYRTYNGDETSMVGANSRVNYKLNVRNYTGKTVSGIEVYFPIPKQGENWGSNLCPEGTFSFDMALSSKGISPAGYKVYYVRGATPSSEKSTWNTYDWTEAELTGSWTADDWSSVNFVKIVKSEIVDKTDDELAFDLNVQNATPEQMNTVNVWQTYYLRILEGVTAFRAGEPVATTLVPGVIGGTIWYDANVNGNIDTGETVLPGTKVELYDHLGNLKQTVTTDTNGKYLFEGLLETAETKEDTTGKTIKEPLFSVKVTNPTDPTDVTNLNRYVEFTIKTDDTDMKFTAAADQKTAAVEDISSNEEDGSLKTDAGLIQKKDLVGNLKVSKTVTGTASKAGKTFEFTVTLGENLTGTYGDMTFKNGISTFTLGDGESKTAKDLPSRITYKVTEAANSQYITTKENDEGTIGVQTTEEATFSNHRDLIPVTMESTDLPVVTKAFTTTSDKRPDKKNFTFSIAGEDEAPESATSTATVNGEGVATAFGDIIFTKPGTYSYLITENTGTDKGYTYDKTVYTYQVTVVENDGVLVVTDKKIYKGTGDTKELQIGNGITFTNSYAVTSCKTTTTDIPVVKKTFTADSAARPIEKTFSFEFTAKDNAPEMDSDTATVKDAGTASGFGTITFDKAGTYSYEIAEVDKGEKGYTYDDTKYVYSIVVEDKDSKLEIVSKTLEKDGKAVSAVTFENEYKVSSTELAGADMPKITKAFTGSTVRPEEKTFTFAIEPQKDAPVPGKTTTTVTGPGTAGEFGKVIFTKAGKYTYLITENIGTDAGYTYDKTVYTYEVTVEDKESKLEIRDKKIYKGTGDTKELQVGNDIIFTNSYAVKAVTVDPPVEKKISGDTPKSKDTFTFTMKAADKKYPMPEGSKNGVKTATVKGAGKVEFGEYEYTTAGTYVYEITEVSGTNKAYSYDDIVYTITDNVSDDGGTLKVDRAITDGVGKSVKSCKFTNKYTKPTSENNKKPIVNKQKKKDTDVTNKSNTLTDTGDGIEGTGDRDTSKNGQDVNGHINGVQTGDPANVTSLIMMLVIAGGVILLSARRKGKKEKQDSQE